MGYIEAVAEQGHTGNDPLAGILSDRRKPPETAQSREEIRVDTGALKSQVSALLETFSIALSKLKSQSGSENRISIYEAGRAQALQVLAALDTPGFALTELAGMEAAISANLVYNEETSNDPDKPSNTLTIAPAAMIEYQQQLHRHVQEDELMMILSGRTLALGDIAASHAVLEEHSVGSVYDAKADLNDAISLATLLYNAKQDGIAPQENPAIQEFLAATREKLLEDAQTSAAYQGASMDTMARAVDERMQLIQDQALRIQNGTEMGEAAAAHSIVDAAIATVDFHAHKLHMRSDAHFDNARAHMSDSISYDAMDEFKKSIAEWNTQRHLTHLAITSMLSDAHAKIPAQEDSDHAAPRHIGAGYLEGLLHAHHIDGILEEAVQRRHHDAGMLKSHQKIMDSAYAHALATQKEYEKLLLGTSGAEAEHGVAESLGMSTEALHAHVTAFHGRNKNGLIAEINSHLHETRHHHHNHQGAHLQGL